ncbi:unnamed protein product [Ceutorhynchus assimilis]|uniref:Uncharacterized protein n=1 Tax=Ceutorhynchus assimilis TaxID=467358 RepID=A0A9N9QJ53_9CUCU|nr:unnamed protein product [Ceutorhynchus assimilis]
MNMDETQTEIQITLQNFRDMDAYIRGMMALISDEISKNDLEYMYLKNLVIQKPASTPPPPSSPIKNSKIRIISDIRINSSSTSVKEMRPALLPEFPAVLPELNLDLPPATYELPDLDEWCSY